MQAGGRVVQLHGPRVQGLLAVSRAIGDHSLRPYVTACPEVTHVARKPGDELLLLGSDGLWSVMSCQVGGQACNAGRVRRGLGQRALPGARDATQWAASLASTSYAS